MSGRSVGFLLVRHLVRGVVYGAVLAAVFGGINWLVEAAGGVAS